MRLVVLTGASGAGKTTIAEAIEALEDDRIDTTLLTASARLLRQAE